MGMMVAREESLIVEATGVSLSCRGEYLYFAKIPGDSGVLQSECIEFEGLFEI